MQEAPQADRKTVSLRFSMEDAQERRAWEIVQSVPQGRRQKFIRTSILQHGDGITRRDIEDAIFRAVQRAISQLPAGSYQGEGLVADDASEAQDRDDDMQKALDFIASLG